MKSPLKNGTFSAIHGFAVFGFQGGSTCVFPPQIAAAERAGDAPCGTLKKYLIFISHPGPIVNGGRRSRPDFFDL